MATDATLSIFVDESGRFQFPDRESPYYIVSLVMHDQRILIEGLIAELDRHFAEMRLSNVCFHAGPLIRQKNAFAIMDWSFRNKIFRRMLAFANKLDFQYHCLTVEKRFINSKEQIVSYLQHDMDIFFDSLVGANPEFSRFKVYYDCGQTPVTNMLRSTFRPRPGLDIEFAQAVRPERYKLFQVADMIATLKLVELKIEHGEPMTESEYKFFGGVRNFKRNYLRFVKAKEI
jgi:hypothetical protein